MKKVLVVEDEYAIRDMIALNLRRANYEVITAESAEQALERYSRDESSFDIAILDIMLPGISGLSLCEHIRARNNRIGIIILSAKTQENDKISGFSNGADDYVTKPFSTSELLARVDALCRRTQRDSTKTESRVLTSGEFVMDLNSRIVTKSGRELELTQVEFQIMELFFENSGVALDRDTILNRVWGENYYGDVKIVDVNIRRLRMKVEDEPSDPRHIVTVWGFGYRWSPDR